MNAGTHTSRNTLHDIWHVCWKYLREKVVMFCRPRPPLRLLQTAAHSNTIAVDVHHGHWLRGQLALANQTTTTMTVVTVE